MREEKRNADNPSDRYRTEYIGVRVSPKQKGNIRQPVQKCGMTVSGYIPERDSGYRPEARLAGRQKSVMDPLAVCRGNLANYTSTLRWHGPGKAKTDVWQLSFHARMAQGTWQVGGTHIKGVGQRGVGKRSTRRNKKRRIQ